MVQIDIFLDLQSLLLMFILSTVSYFQSTPETLQVKDGQRKENRRLKKKKMDKLQYECREIVPLHKAQEVEIMSQSEPVTYRKYIFQSDKLVLTGSILYARKSHQGCYDL